MKKGGRIKVISSILLAISLILVNCTWAFAATSTLDEAKKLIKAYYLEPVSDSVLEATSVTQLIKNLNDPWAAYYTASQYEEYIKSINNQFAGIGVYIESDSRGLLITKVISGSPAEKGNLQAGDVIISVNGRSLAGVPSETGISWLRGEEGTTVTLTVLRGDTAFQVTLTRQVISEPTVRAYWLDGDIIYINISTFGSDTGAEFGELVEEIISEYEQYLEPLGGKIRGWIIDFSNNGGGFAETAADLGGYFFGETTLTQIEYNNGVVDFYTSHDHKIDFKAPVIFIANRYTASASEMLLGAVKDYKTGLIIGETTYGKGKMQSMFTLSDKSVIKFTVARFLSPEGHKIDGVGVKPDLYLEDSDYGVDIAYLLLTGKDSPTEDKRGLLKLTVNGQDYYIDQTLARDELLWESMYQLMTSLRALNSDNAELNLGTANGWQKVDLSGKFPLWTLYYSDYQSMPALTNVNLDKVFTVKFSAPVDQDTVSEETVELIDSVTGERLPVSFSFEGDSVLKINPDYLLSPDTTYYLVIHPGIKGANGAVLKEGVVTPIETVLSTANADAAESLAEAA